jgi:signal transduction histidine kinase
VQTVRYLENQGILVVAIVIFLVLIFGYFLSVLLVKPFRNVTKAIEDVTDGYENEAISVPDYTETVQITDAFNKMLARVRSLDNSRQEFVSNVSHELKTPLTSMKVLADSLNGQENVPIEIYQEFMGDITQEIDRENKIIQDLLSMVRMNGKAAKLDLEKVEIGEMLEDIIRRLKPIAAKRNIELIMDSYKPTVAEVDQTKLSLAFSNLIENGIKYNIDNGWVRINLKSDHKFFTVTVSDCGLGIPEDQQSRIFERFYRGDTSHSDKIEGTGLGLAITKDAVLMHRGTITVKSKVREGSTFTVKIPLVHQSNS